MLSQAQALYNLEVLANRKRPQIAELFKKYGYPNVPVQPDTIASMALVVGAPLTEDLYNLTRSFSFHNERTLVSYEGMATNPEQMSKTDFQIWFERITGVVSGANKIINPEEPEDKPQQSDGKILGIPAFWFYVIVFVVLITILAIIAFA